VASWNAMILGYAQSELVDEALSLSHQMQLAGLKPNLTTWTGMMDGYVDIGINDQRYKIHRTCN